jgi:HAD superfamily hydrolase (TIGR01509 family)
MLAILVAVIRAVIFDLDGVLLDSEPLWDAARREVAASHGGRWHAGATAAMQGMSSPEWSRYMHTELGVELAEGRIVDLVVGGLLARYGRGLPLMPGAAAAVERVARRWPLGLASSANRVVIDTVLDAAFRGLFRATVSSEEVARGKPAPDVYLEAARRMGQAPQDCAAVEDSANGIRSAVEAGLQVVAVPDRHQPPPAGVLAAACVVVGSLTELTEDLLGHLEDGAPGRVTRHGTGRAPGSWRPEVDRADGDLEDLREVEDHIDEEEIESFPASDPHSDWAGPGS